MKRYVSRFNRSSRDQEPGIYEGNIKISELPELPFWETDWVLFKGKKYLVLGVVNYEGRVSYNITKKLGSSNYIANVPAGELTLVKKGNLWRMFHGKRLHFADVPDEANFYLLLGRAQDVRNTRDFTWTRYEALSALKDGRADAILPGSYYSPGRLYMVSYMDEDVGKRVRKYQIRELEKALAKG